MSNGTAPEVTSSGGIVKFNALRRGHTKLERGMAMAFALSSAYGVVKNRYARVRSHYEYHLVVHGDDVLYPDVHKWLIENLPEDDQKSVIVRSSERRGSDEAVPVQDSGTKPKPPTLSMFFNGNKEQQVMIGGHKIRVGVESETERNYMKRYQVEFHCQGLAARNAVIELFNHLVSVRQGGDRKPRMFIANQWGGWDLRDDLVPRSLDSVVLAAGVKEEIVNDLEKFRRNEPDYVRMGVPYHRGYLFHGPPGSGKTSIAKALASHFGMDVYYMPLSDLEQDASLITMVSRVPAGCVLLLEDIDIAHPATDRDDDTDKPAATLSGLLNAIDGVATPHGLIVMMTTNRRETLDEALLRPGRVDLDVKIDYVDLDQADRLLKMFAGTTLASTQEPYNVSSAEIVGVILKNVGDADKAALAVKALMEGRT